MISSTERRAAQSIPAGPRLDRESVDPQQRLCVIDEHAMPGGEDAPTLSECIIEMVCFETHQPGGGDGASDRAVAGSKDDVLVEQADVDRETDGTAICAEEDSADATVTEELVALRALEFEHFCDTAGRVAGTDRLAQVTSFETIDTRRERPSEAQAARCVG